jgi:hypothetical protein
MVFLLSVSETARKLREMKLSKARYQHGSIAKIPRASGFVWRMRFSESSGGKRNQKSMTFSGIDYSTESEVRRAIEHAVIQQNRALERAEVDAGFSDLRPLYSTQHDNLVIIRNVPGLAAEYAVNIWASTVITSCYTAERTARHSVQLMRRLRAPRMLSGIHQRLDPRADILK